MTHLVHVKRALTACLLAALFPVLMVAHANAGPTPQVTLNSGHDAVPTPRTYDWTSSLSREFPGCQRHVSGVAAAFVVEREDGRMQRLPFDTVWAWTHDHSGQSPRVWVRGQCR